jgi:endonuclease/exonuclease/phosphatase family metal-dependent hydrolase
VPLTRIIRTAVALTLLLAVFDGDARAQSPATLRLLHWNVHHGGIGSDGRYDPNRIATWIATMNPDIASLNEVDTQAQVTAIVGALNTRTGVTWRTVFSGQGNLVISRLPLAASSATGCRYDPSFVAFAPHARVLVNGRTINLWSSHLHVSSASARLAEVQALQACALRESEARILAGDYNMQYNSTEYKAAVVGYADAWLAAKAIGATVNYSGNCDGCTRNSRIDYVFTSTGASFLRVKSAQVFDTRDANGVMASDHKPLLVVYEVTAETSTVSTVQNLRLTP